MKNFIILLLLFCTLTTFGQRGKDKGKDPQAQIDTLTKANTALTASNKTLST